MLKLQWRRVDLSFGLVYLNPEDQKNAKVGSVPLNREARAALASRAQLKTTMRYAHLAPENARAAVNVLDARSSRFGHVEDDREASDAA